MSVYRECGAGWNALLDALEAELRALGVEPTPQQVKEKWGTLRYYHPFPEAWGAELVDEVRVAINRAELRSARTCEDCGAPGTLRRGRWLRTLCDACAAARAAARGEAP